MSQKRQSNLGDLSAEYEASDSEITRKAEVDDVFAKVHTALIDSRAFKTNQRTNLENLRNDCLNCIQLYNRFQFPRN